jgi:hypothetical protein
MSKVNFIHRRDVINGKILNSGGYTIAYREVADGIEYAPAYCSPSDNFNRQTGRIKAEGRLNSDRYRRFIKMSFEDFKALAYTTDIV